jgi:DNA-damage-inducible protein J
MPNVTVQSRVSLELKEEADAIFAAIGISTADAIRLFLQQVVNSGGLPFQPTARRPNTETRNALQELENGGGQVFQTPDELFADWRS